MNVRNRLLLLVFSVWLPAVAGIVLLATGTYEREAEAARQTLRRLALGLVSLVDGELDTRAAMVGSLGASLALRDGDLARFGQELEAATRNTGHWAVLMTRGEMVFNARGGGVLQPARPRPAGGPFTTGEPVAHFSPSGPVTQQPVVAVFGPERHVSPPRYNVAVAFTPAVLQALVSGMPLPASSTAAVMDDQQRIVARSRDPETWLGRPATGDIARRAQERAEGFVASRTLDGIETLAYTAPSRYGWAVVIGIPQSALADAARRVTLQAAGAAALLLVVGLVLAARAAQRISGPLRALSEGAAELGRQRVPPRLASGLAEADEVSAALQEAALALREATQSHERRVAEAVRAAEQAQARLLDGQKHEAIGRLSGGVAHDFNNLLQTIGTALHMVGRAPLDEPQRRVLEAASRAAARAAGLVRQMLAFGRAQELRPVPVALDDFVLQGWELTSKALGERLRLSARIDPGLPPLFVDATQLELALLNLVFNARDAMAEGGDLAIEARLAAPEETAHLGPGRFVRLDVVDDGPGMEEGVRLRAAEPYFTTKPMGAGSGLGLAQVGAFARQSGGEMTIDSAPGRGTRVSLWLPTTPARPPSTEAPAPLAAPSRPLRVLMVEDELLLASVVRPALEEAGHRVVLVGTADEAVARLADGFEVDIVFTDVVMPGRRSGMDLVRWLRAERPSMPVVVATGYSAERVDGDTELLRKPYAIPALLDALQRAVARRSGA